MSTYYQPNTVSPNRLRVIQKNQFVQCSLHEEYEITNFCVNCQKPLCPECMIEHTNIHKANQTYYNIDTIHRVREDCLNHLRMARERFVFEHENISGISTGNHERRLNICIQRREARDKYIKLVSNQFESIEDTLIRKFRELPPPNPAQYKKIEKKLSATVNEIDNLNKKVASPDYVAPVLKVLEK